jgi:hypothetical protein
MGLRREEKQPIRPWPGNLEPLELFDCSTGDEGYWSKDGFWNMKKDLRARGVSPSSLSHQSCTTETILHFGVRKAWFRIPQQKPLDGEAPASMQTRASETRGTRIEAKENVFPGVGSWDFRLNYQNTLNFLPLGSKISIVGFYRL